MSGKLKTGDRVEIVAARHPWCGHRGRIVAAFGSADFDWKVEIEGETGHQSACMSSDLRRLPYVKDEA